MVMPEVQVAPMNSSGGPDSPKLREILAQMCGGRDLTQLPAHTHYGVLQPIGEVGTDLTKWPTEKHFTAWTGLAPGNHATDEAQCLAMLVRRDSETLDDLLRRLDAAIADAYENDRFADEIDAPPASPAQPRKRRR
jgi:hypothetical protein